MFKLIIGAVIAAFLVIGGFMVIDPNLNAASNSAGTVVSDKFKYTIEGEVAKPGTYSLDDNITLIELINAAGGITFNADPLAYFENATVSSNNTYYIATKYDVTDVCNNEPIVKVNINKDDVTTLKTINGITSAIAESIISYRTSNGNFSLIEQLMDVYGVGTATYRKVRNYVTLHE